MGIFLVNFTILRFLQCASATTAFVAVVLWLGDCSVTHLLVHAIDYLVAIRPRRPHVKFTRWIFFRPWTRVRHTLMRFHRGALARTTVLIVCMRNAAVALLESSAIAVGVMTPRTPLAVNDYLVSARRAVTILE